ncbi:MAG TPA: lectin-like protein, partial [Nannocystaceae bacterium]|nr:lectin-like protein [Nannocystaceae bacterium]
SWIGLNDQWAESQFEWDLGASGTTPLAAGFTNWEPGEPTGDDCVRMVGNALWEDRSCGTPTRYVCERPLQ